MKNIKDYLGTNTVIHTKTLEEWNVVTKDLRTECVTKFDEWDFRNYKENTVVNLRNKGWESYGNIVNVEPNTLIIQGSEFLEQQLIEDFIYY